MALTRVSSKDITISGDRFYDGGTSDGDVLWVLYNHIVYAYNLDGTRNSSRDITGDSSLSYSAIVTDGTYFWFVVNYSDRWARAYSALNGSRQSSKDIDLPNDHMTGAAFYDGTLWFLTRPDSWTDNWDVIAYDSTTLNRKTSHDFSIPGASSSDPWESIVIDGNSIFIIRKKGTVIAYNFSDRLRNSSLDLSLDAASNSGGYYGSFSSSGYIWFIRTDIASEATPPDIAIAYTDSWPSYIESDIDSGVPYISSNIYTVEPPDIRVSSSTISSGIPSLDSEIEVAFVGRIANAHIRSGIPLFSSEVGVSYPSIVGKVRSGALRFQNDITVIGPNSYDPNDITDYWKENLYRKFIPDGWKALDQDNHLKEFITSLAHVFDISQSWSDDFPYLWDIDGISEDFYPYIANSLGFDLIESDLRNTKKLQLKNAVDIFSKEGTLSSINSFFNAYTYRIVLVPQWTKDYETFYDEGDTRVGLSVLEGGEWYPTSRYRIRIISDTDYELTEEQVDDVLHRIDRISPINSVFVGYYYEIPARIEGDVASGIPSIGSTVRWSKDISFNSSTQSIVKDIPASGTYLIPDACVNTPGLEKVTTSWGDLIRVTNGGGTGDMRITAHVSGQSAGAAPLLYYKDGSLPSNNTDGTIITWSDGPNWSPGNAYSADWNSGEVVDADVGRYFWIRPGAATDITGGTLQVRFVYTHNTP